MQGMNTPAFDTGMERMIYEQLISSCPITVHGIHNSDRIFAPDLPGLRRKMV